MVLAVGGQQGLGLDGVAQGGAGAVCLDGVDVGGGQPGAGQGGVDDALLGGPVRRGQAVARAVLVDGRAADHGQDGVAAGAGVAEPLEQQQPGALAPGGAVRGGGEGLAPAVGGQPALPAELDEHPGPGHEGGPAGQGHGAFPVPQRLAGQVQRHQRGGARRVHRQRRAFQAQGVGQPPGRHAGGRPGQQVTLKIAGRMVQRRPVPGGGYPGEHPGIAALQRVRADPGPLDRLPRHLQQHPLLGVHRRGLPGADPEERRVEPVRVVHEPAVPGIAFPGCVRVRVEQPVQIPAPLRRERRDRIHPAGHQVPQVLRAVHLAWVAAAHRHDRDRLILALLKLMDPLACAMQVRSDPLEVVDELFLISH